jgi:hypothetical protein
MQKPIELKHINRLEQYSRFLENPFLNHFDIDIYILFGLLNYLAINKPVA